MRASWCWKYLPCCDWLLSSATARSPARMAASFRPAYANATPSSTCNWATSGDA